MTPIILLAEKEFSREAKSILGKAGTVIDFVDRRHFLRNLPKAHAVLTGLTIKFNRALLGRARRLTVIASRTTQLRYIDLEEAKKRGITVLHIPTSAPLLKDIPSTAEETFALIFGLLRNVPWAFDSVKRMQWKRDYFQGHELKNKTLGIIGFGRLGRMVSHFARAFGMEVIAYDPYVSRSAMERLKVKKVTSEKLLRTADIVSLHAIWSAKTEGMLGRKHFRMMKPTAYFINTARGEITDERPLLDALLHKRIAGAALDTLSGEVPSGRHLVGNPLVRYARTHSNLLILPHLGGATIEAREKTQVYIAKKVVNFLKHQNAK